MSGVGEDSIIEKQQQQQRIWSTRDTDALLFTIANTSKMNLTTNHFDNPTWIYKITFGFICACLCLLTITGNLLVLVTFRRLRKVGNLFILSLATADLIVGCFVMPIAGIYAIMETWNMGLVVCQTWLSVDYTASTASIFNLLTLSLDRYWSITSPLQYLGKRTRARASLLIGLAWGLSLLWVIPIVGWDYFVTNGTTEIDDTKCEPGYMHSKGFKVSTAIINFYLPLLVLICLNGRIYYEIKVRYKNVLLQRHSSKSTDSPGQCRLTQAGKNSRALITTAMYDSDRQACSTTINENENESFVASKPSLTPTVENNLQLRMNIKEKKSRPLAPNQTADHQRVAMKHPYGFVERNYCTQDELTWFAHHEHSPSSINQTPSLRPHRAGSKHRLNVDERCYKHTHDYQSCRIYSNDQIEYSNNHRHDTYLYYPSQAHSSTSSSHTPLRPTTFCRRCSFVDSMRTSPSTISPATPPGTTRNNFHLCVCCSAETSEINIHSNGELFSNTRKISSSSLTSTNSRKANTISTYHIQRNSTSSSVISRSNSYVGSRTSNKIKQSTVWNQQEKAFRQLFAIVFGFTCCFLPYFILYMVVAFCGSCVSERIITATVWLGYVNSTINPFLYALSNKHFRRTFNRIFKRDQRRQSFYN